MSTANNKLAFIARVHERRLREIERRLGITSPPNPLANTSQSGCADAAESQSQEPNVHAVRQFDR